MQKITTSDIDVLVEVYNSSFQKTWNFDDFHKLLKNPAVRGFIIDNIAFILLQTIEDEAEIITIAVEPNARKQGLGKLLIQETQNNYMKIFLEVNATNIPALSLYKSTGFIQSGRRKKYYNNTDDAITMVWQKQ